MIKDIKKTKLIANNKRHQCLHSGVTQVGCMDRFEVFRNNVEGHYGQIGTVYLFDSSFQETSFREGY
jgi:hypothetical protein